MILGACFISKALVLIAGVASMAYIFSSAKWEQKFAFFLFILSFSPIFKFSQGQTSLFMFLRMAIILSYIFQRKGKFSFTFITLVIVFATYSFILSEFYNTSYYVPTINIALWLFTGYVIVTTLSTDVTTPIVRSLINGVILTGIIGLFVRDIPQLAAEISILSSLAEDGATVYRYAAFWSDPNYYTVLLIVSLWTAYFEYNKKRMNNVEFLARCLLISFIGLMTLSKSCLLLLILFWIYVILSKNDIKTVQKVSLVFVMFFAIMIFLWKNPYWISDVFYRFTAGGGETTISTITTGRTDIWIEYIKRMLDDFSWILGRGINAKLYVIGDIARAPHNTYIQMFFSFGLVGTIVYISIFRNMYFNAKKIVNSTSNHQKGPEKIALFSILVTLFFLDGIYIEMYYYMLPLAFVYLLGNNKADVLEYQEV